MSKLLDQVTPLTRGIIWLTDNEKDVQNPHYKDIDYLLDGLLTANLEATTNVTSRVIVGSNFGKPFYVMVIKEVVRSEVESYLSLFEKELISENDFIVLDESKSYEKLKSLLKPISSQIRIG